MSARGKRSAAHKALLIVAPLVLLAYGGVGGWLYLSGPPDNAAAGQSEDKAAATKDDGDKPEVAAKPVEDEPSEAAPAKPESEQGEQAKASDGSETAKPADDKAEDTVPAPPKPEPDTAETDTRTAAEPTPAAPAAPSVPRTEPTAQRQTQAPAPSPLDADNPVLAPAPDPELSTDGPYGPLPVRALNGREPWNVYGRPFKRQRGARLIAIVITELGLAEPPTVSAIQDLPGEVTLAFSPYSRRLAEWVPAARAAGHEVLMQLPMEPRNLALDDPGDRALLSGNDEATNLDNLAWLLSRASGYVGVTSFMGSKLTASETAMRPIMDLLEQRGLAYVDARVTPLSVAGRVSYELGVPTAVNDRFIDPQAARGPIDARLAELEQIAASQGSAVGFAQAYPVTIERLLTWIPEMQRRGYELAPITAVIQP